MVRLKNKSYWRIPGGEVQYGHISKSLVIWFRGRLYEVKRGKV